MLSRLVGALIVLHRATLKVQRLRFDHYIGLKARGVPILFALWHGRMLLPIQRHRHQRPAAQPRHARAGTGRRRGQRRLRSRR